MKHPRLTIVSIGPGDPSLLNQATLDELRSADPLVLRTDRHPLSAWLREQEIPFTSLDDLYEQTEDFDEMAVRMAERLLGLSGMRPVYAVADMLTDRSVDALFRLSGNTDLSVVPGFSYADFYLSRCRGRFSSAGVRVVAASDFLDSFYDPDETVLITEIDQAITAGEIKEKLSALLDDEENVCLLNATGKPAELPLYELDRQRRYDHLTAVLVPAVDYLRRSRNTLRDLRRIMERLRAPDGCPWDSVQTHESLRPYVVEEAWESVNAIDEQDPDHLADELGDLLFQIVFHASIGASRDEFTLDDVITHICTKMIHRHPHVFGSSHFSSAGEVADQWESMKRAETGSRTVSESLNDVSQGLPALKYAIKVNKKAQQIPAYRADPSELAARIRDFTASLLNTDGTLNEACMGRLLFLCTHLCHRFEADAEIILHQTVERFKKRFARMEKEITSAGKSPESLTFNEICVYLDSVEEGN